MLDLGDVNRVCRRLRAARMLGSGQTARIRDDGREIDNVDVKDNKTIYFNYYIIFFDIILVYFIAGSRLVSCKGARFKVAIEESGVLRHSMRADSILENSILNIIKIRYSTLNPPRIFPQLGWQCAAHRYAEVSGRHAQSATATSGSAPSHRPPPIDGGAEQSRCPRPRHGHDRQEHRKCRKLWQQTPYRRRSQSAECGSPSTIISVSAFSSWSA